MKVLMVCLGNICRSPLAHGILDYKLKERNLDWIVDSCGTGGWHVGELPDKRSIDIARKNGLDITYQRARQLRSSDIDEFDFIFAMDTNNYEDILRYCHTERERVKVKLILNEVYPNEFRSVPDPYYGGVNGFQDVYKMLDEACERIIERYILI